MWRVLRDRGGDERGAVMAIVGVLIVLVFLPLAALAIDIPSYDQAQRQAQAAADAGALAASQDLASTPGSASTDATSYATTNFPGATVNVNVDTTGKQATVSVTGSTPTFFGNLMGSPTKTVTATAVAAATSTSSTAPAFFAYGTSCSNDQGIYINPGNVNVPGGIVSNAGITMAGTGGVYGPSTYGGPNDCAFNPNSGIDANTFGGSNTYAPKSTSPVTTSWPNTFASFPSPTSACTYYGDSLTLQNDDGTTLPSGTYCYNTININGSKLAGNVTFQASNFQLNGTGETFTPYYKKMLFYFTGSSFNVLCNGPANWLSGGIYAPTGAVNLNGCTGTINSFVEAQSITLAGNGPATWNSTLTNPTGGLNTIGLTQ